MSGEPTPYTPPAGMVLSTLGEVRRLGLDWAHTATPAERLHAGDRPGIFGATAVLVYPKPRPTVEIDAESLVALWDGTLDGQLVSDPLAMKMRAAVDAAREVLS